MDMRGEFAEPFEARAYVDTGPILERVGREVRGPRLVAKNTLLINQKLGSWLFLGVIITTLDLEPTLATGQAPAPGFVRKLHAMPGCLPDGRFSTALRARFTALHCVS